MIAVIENVGESLVDLIIEDSGFWFQLPKEVIFGTRIPKEGSRIKFTFTPLQQEQVQEEHLRGGFIKNPPRRELI